MKSFLNKVEEYIIMITLPLMVILIFTATIFRYFKLGSITWAEESSRYLMIWLAFAGISLGFKTNAHLGLSFFVDRFPVLGQKILFILRIIIVTFFGVLLAFFSYVLVNNIMKNGQLSPALGLPMWIAYSAILFGSLLIIVRTLQFAVITMKKNNFVATEREKGEE